MKLELIHKIDQMGERYQVKKNDGLPESFWVSSDSDREIALANAKTYYERCKLPTEETIILSETV